MFRPEVYEVTEDGIGWINRLLVLHENELLPSARGHGIGAGASARSIDVLAGNDDATLIVTKPAPMDRADFMPAGDSDRDMTAAEQQAWDAARDRITAHWREMLGLIPVDAGDTTVLLIGTGCSMVESRRAQRADWPERW